jgi:hypothetical protein
MADTDPDIEDLKAADAFRDTLLEKADGHDEGGAPLWFGWAIMSAFLEGAEYARQQKSN